MAEVKHTLRVEGGANSHFFDGRLMDQDDECLAFVDMHHPITPIIAAAPDLFEALCGLANALEIEPGPGGRLNLVPEALLKARAALSKATAQQEGR